MKTNVFSKNDKFFKANLHCHTTFSDGRFTPAEIKEGYKRNGYSIVAFSDHNVLIDHSYLNDEEFLALTAIEVDLNYTYEGSMRGLPCYHINFFSRDQHATKIPCFNPQYVKNKKERRPQEYIGTPDYVRDYTKANELIAEFTKHNFITMVNHPAWSLQGVEDYEDLDNVFALEIYNHGCYVEGFEDNGSTHVYDKLLKKGKKIFCTATDDNHNGNWNNIDENDPMWDSYGGWVMIKSENLEYGNIMNALENGDFYASTGAEIKELYIEDNKLYVTTSPAARITINGYGRKAIAAYPKADEETVCEAVFPLDRFYDGGYVRVTVEDGRGHFAWSQPIWGNFEGMK